MEDTSELGAAGYLRSHMESKWDPANPSSNELYKPADNVDYQRKGTVESSFGNSRLNFSYGPVDKLPFHFHNFVAQAGGAKENLRVLNDLTISDGQGHNLDLKSLLPKNGKAYIDPFYKNAEIAEKSLSDRVTGNVVVFGDPTAPSTVLTLFHELGHLQEPGETDEDVQKNERALYGKRSNPSDAVHVLQKERNAWAFALRMSRPFISKDPNIPLNRDAVRSLIHDNFLKAYSDQLRGHLPEWVFEIQDEIKTATIRQAVDSDIGQILAEQDLGLTQYDEKLEARCPLTPIDQATISLVISKPMYSLFGEERETTPATENQKALAMMCVEVYKKEMEIWRERSRQRADELMKNRRKHNYRVGEIPDWAQKSMHRGETAKILDYIAVGPFGPIGRYQVNFNTVHNKGEDDLEIQGNGYMFDEQARSFNKSYPAREDNNYVVARKDGRYEVVGKYSDIYEETEGLVDELLVRKGYTDPAEIHPMGWGGHVGWLKESTTQQPQKQ